MATSFTLNRDGQINTTDSTPTTIVTFPMASLMCAKLKVSTVSISPDNNNTKSWDQMMMAKRLNGSSVTSGLSNLLTPLNDLGAATWTLQAVAVGNDIQIQVIGQAGTKINWFTSVWGTCIVED